jgi:hypothetical protein
MAMKKNLLKKLKRDDWWIGGLCEKVFELDGDDAVRTVGLKKVEGFSLLRSSSHSMYLKWARTPKSILGGLYFI